MAKWRNPFANAQPTTVGLIGLTALWALFQWRDPTPPPALDQALVAAFGMWFAREAIDKKSPAKRKTKARRSDPADDVTVDDDEDEDDEEDR